MDPNLQFGLVAAAAFTGAALNNTGEWFRSKDETGARETFVWRKFLSSLVTSAYASFGIAAAYQLKQVFGLPELFGAALLGAGAQQINNRARG